MKSGKCPKCNSREIYKHTSKSGHSNLEVTMFKQAKSQDYVCAACGYKETYVMNNEDLKKIKEKWERVGY